MTGIERILLEVGDRSEARAVGWTLALARTLEARVIAVRVIPPIPDGPDAEERLSALEESAWKVLYEVEDDAFELDVKISLVLEQGDPAGRLLELAGGYRVHLLVVGPDPELDPARLAQFSPIPIVFVNDSKEV